LPPPPGSRESPGTVTQYGSKSAAATCADTTKARTELGWEPRFDAGEVPLDLKPAPRLLCGPELVCDDCDAVLQQEDFEVYDNGKLQTLTNFIAEITPFTAIVMLDTSGSMTLNLDFVKQAAEEFLIRLLPEDKAKVGAFNDKIQILPRDEPFTNNRDRLIRLVKEGLDFGYPTRLWDAVDESIAHMEPVEGRRVVVVFTDGDDSASKRGRNDVLDRAREKDMMVYAIGLQSDYFNGQSRVRTRPDRGLKVVAEETGGGFFELTKKDELGPTFTRVAQELHSQYVLGFSPAALDGKIHKLAAGEG